MELPNTYDNEQRFIFSNWTDEDFDGQWGGVVTTIKKGETKELPMYLAYHFTKHLVDRELNKAGKEGLLGVPEQRQPLEEKTIAPLGTGMDSPALASLKEKIREEIIEVETKKKRVTKKAKAIETGEFADLK